MSRRSSSPDSPVLRGPGSEGRSRPQEDASGPLVDAPPPTARPTGLLDEDADAEDLLADMGFDKIAKLQMPPELNSSEGRTRPLIKTLTMNKFDKSIQHAQRPGFTKVGRDIVIRINSHRVESYPTSDVFQYDVSLRAAQSPVL